MATHRARALRAAGPHGTGVRAGLQSFRATDLSRSRVAAWGGSGDSHADDRTRSVLRDLARDLERNAEPFHILLHGCARLAGSPMPRPLVGDQAWREQAVAAFRADARRTRGGLDARGACTFAALCKQWWTAFWRDGDVLAIPLAEGGIATIEADCIAGGSSKNQHARVVGGVHLDGAGRFTGFSVCGRTTAGTPDPKTARLYPADTVSYLADLWSASHTRGLPRLTAALDNQERIDALVEAEVISAEQASNLYGAFEREAVANLAAPSPPLAGDTTSPGAAYTGGTGAPHLIEATAGSFWDLPAGMTWKGFQATRPNLNVPEMSRQLLRQTCGFFGIPFHVVFCDFMGVNWSGNRGLVQLTRDALAWWRCTYFEPFLDPIWSWWLRRAIAAGRLPYPAPVEGQPRITRLDDPRLGSTGWDWPDLEWPDPSREAQAFDLRYQQGTTSLTRYLGPDWTLVQDEQQRERLRADDLYVKRCRAAAQAVATVAADVPGLTWREVINRDISPNTVSTIPLQQAPKPAADDAGTADEVAGTAAAVLLSYDTNGRPVLHGV